MDAALAERESPADDVEWAKHATALEGEPAAGLKGRRIDPANRFRHQGSGFGLSKGNLRLVWAARLTAQDVAPTPDVRDHLRAR